MTSEGETEALLQGEYRLEERMMLKAEHWRHELFLGDWQVFNEVVVCRGRYVRPIQLHASVDGYLLASYVADGLIAATPTGFTSICPSGRRPDLTTRPAQYPGHTRIPPPVA